MIETAIIFLAAHPGLLFIGTFAALYAIFVSMIVTFGGGSRRF